MIAANREIVMTRNHLSSEKKAVAILGANGTVGQKVLTMLTKKPYCDYFVLKEIAASDNRVGKVYEEETLWRETEEIPSFVKKMVFKNLKEISSSFVISALPADVALTIEPFLAQKGCHIFSNASAFRMDADTPLMVPEINQSHQFLCEQQKTPGKIITNPNCSTVFLVLALAPLLECSPLEHLSVTTMQAISGAGYPGVASLDILGNLVPNIAQEEKKIREETKKILGDGKKAASFTLSVQVNRVPVLHGHTISFHGQFKKSITPEMATVAYQKWNQRWPGLFCLYEDAFSPRPLHHVHAFDQRVHIGRLQQGEKNQLLSGISMGHNLVRGAAGAALINMMSFCQLPLTYQ
jgi:aspartate-semialdehyde dehydrogenase